MGLYKYHVLVAAHIKKDYLSQELRRTCEADWRATGFRKLSLAWQSDALTQTPLPNSQKIGRLIRSRDPASPAGSSIASPLPKNG